MKKIIVFLCLLLSVSNLLGQKLSSEREIPFFEDTKENQEKRKEKANQKAIEILERYEEWQKKTIVYSVIYVVGTIAFGYFVYRARKENAKNPQERKYIYSMLAHGMLLGVIGHIVGYFLFGKNLLTKQYVAFRVIPQDYAGDTIIEFIVLELIQLKILICWAVGFISGLVIGKR